MDSGAETTQRVVIGGAIVLAIVIVLVIGYSLYTKAKRAEGELANKEALDAQTKQKSNQANVSLTGEAQKSPSFSYDGLIQKGTQQNSTSTNFEIVNENANVSVPQEATGTPEQVPIDEDTKPATPPAPKKVVKPVDPGDRPLTAEEIYRIRQLPIDNSPSGNLQTSLEAESNGEYRARY